MLKEPTHPSRVHSRPVGLTGSKCSSSAWVSVEQWTTVLCRVGTEETRLMGAVHNMARVALRMTAPMPLLVPSRGEFPEGSGGCMAQRVPRGGHP